MSHAVAYLAAILALSVIGGMLLRVVTAMGIISSSLSCGMITDILWPVRQPFGVQLVSLMEWLAEDCGRSPASAFVIMIAVTAIPVLLGSWIRRAANRLPHRA